MAVFCRLLVFMQKCSPQRVRAPIRLLKTLKNFIRVYIKNNNNDYSIRIPLWNYKGTVMEPQGSHNGTTKEREIFKNAAHRQKKDQNAIMLKPT